MYLQWLLLFCCFVKETVTVNFTEVMEPIKNETNKTGLIDRTYCTRNYENKETSIYEFPWLVGIKADYGLMICSGSLINTRYMLTNAECAISVNYWSGYSILLGDFNLKPNHTNCKNLTESNIDECFNFESYGVEENIPHPLFNVSTFAPYNVGLLRLNRTVTYKEHIRPICLPEFETTTPKPGDTLYLSGWIVDISTNTAKKKIATTSITRAECREKLKKCSLDHYDFYTLYDNNECIMQPAFQNNRYDLIADFGDNGGAVMSFNNNQWKMEGILLTLKDEICKDVPLIYTRISMYLDWIEENMRPWN